MQTKLSSYTVNNPAFLSFPNLLSSYVTSTGSTRIHTLSILRFTKIKYFLRPISTMSSMHLLTEH